MEHFVINPTPICKLNYFSNKFGVNLLCKRDDLFDKAGGGSKARMLQYILASVTPSNCDVIVTAGGPCSNFNRACALMCANLGITMHLIEYTDEPKEWNSLNHYLCDLIGIRRTICPKSEVPETINCIIKKYKDKGVKCKYIYGGGKSLEGFYAYYDAINELNKQVKDIDALFVACGTGTTLTGICAGMQKFYPNSKVYAISTARTKEAEYPVLLNNMSELNMYLASDFNFDNLEFNDTYLCGGYAKYNKNIANVIKESLSKEGLIIDPTYSGKAFYGMTDIIKKKHKEFANKTILFWNTGGLFNLLSTKYDKEISCI